ncbi:integrase [Bradyrhizobium sp. LA7.1]
MLTGAKSVAADRQFTWDPNFPGFGLQTTKTGHQSFVYQYRAGTISRRMKLDGSWFRFEAQRAGKPAPAAKGTARATAKREAEAARGAIAQGRDPLAEMRKAKEAAGNTFKAIAEDYLARDGSRLRSKEDREDVLKRLVYPRIGAKQIDAIKRRDIVKMLDKVEEENGPVQADHVLAYVRKIFNWHAARTDDFNSPIVRGMARTKPKERRRQRILTDDELRAVWKAAEGQQTPFAWLVRFILLTMTRRNESARMSRREAVDGNWTIPAKRHKSKKDFLLPLSQAAADLLSEIPTIGRRNDPYVFTTSGKTPISGFSKFKADFDKLCGVTGWTLHDLRRTGRTLCSRAGADPDHAELAYGHTVQGVRGVYDVWQYRDEKLRVFELLAAQIERIVHPVDNVVALRS